LWTNQKLPWGRLLTTTAKAAQALIIVTMVAGSARPVMALPPRLGRAIGRDIFSTVTMRTGRAVFLVMERHMVKFLSAGGGCLPLKAP